MFDHFFFWFPRCPFGTRVRLCVSLKTPPQICWWFLGPQKRKENAFLGCFYVWKKTVSFLFPQFSYVPLVIFKNNFGDTLPLMFPTKAYSNDSQQELRAVLIGMRLDSCQVITGNFAGSLGECGTNSTCNVLAVGHKYCLQCETNIICSVGHILFVIWDKYYLRCETNIVLNVRQIPFAVRDKYCAAAKICTLAKIAEVAKLTWSPEITILNEIRQRWKVKMLWLSHASIIPYHTSVG